MIFLISNMFLLLSQLGFIQESPAETPSPQNMTPKTMTPKTMAIDTSIFQDAQRNHFATHASGWIVQNTNSFQRIYMGDSPDDILLWIDSLCQQMHIKVAIQTEPFGTCDASWSLQNQLFCQIDTIGLYTEGEEAIQLMENLLSQIQPYQIPPFSAPLVTMTNEDNFTIEISDSNQWSFIEGNPIYGNPLTFSIPPKSIILWNQYAQSSQWTWNHHEYELDKSPRHSEIIPINRL